MRSVGEEQECLRRAAVLVPMQQGPGGDLSITLIQRSIGIAVHSGETAFPGGCYDPRRDESLLATALREAEEEIGLEPSLVSIIGVLPERWTVSSRFLVTPFLARIPLGCRFVPDEREVQSVFSVPLSRFGGDQPPQWQQRELEGRTVSVPCVRVAGRVVWGLTLHIIEDLLLRGD